MGRFPSGLAILLLSLLLRVGSLESGGCNIEKHIVTDMDRHLVFPANKPMVYVFTSARNEKLMQETSAANIKTKYKDVVVTLSSSDAHSSERRKELFGQYVDTVLNEENKVTSLQANESWYLFGHNEHILPFNTWARLYDLPSCEPCYEDRRTMVFGLGAKHSGVSFHLHGPGLSEVFHGKKRWFLYAPGCAPPSGFDVIANTTIQSWINNHDEFGKCSSPPITVDRDGESKEEQQLFYDCTIGSNELLWFPQDWMHATLNTEPYTMFVSVFL